MFRFDRAKFYAGYRNEFGALTQQQTDGLNFLLDSIEKDSFLEFISWPAYMLGTTKLETNHTFQPIHEIGSHAYFCRRYGSQTKVGHGLGNLTTEDGATFSGEGDVQMTGRANSVKATASLRKQYPEVIAEFEQRTGKKFDLVANPEERGDPIIAYCIMSFGMRSGLFTGKKLVNYLNADKTDYQGARKIINPGDHSTTVAEYAESFESILTDALITESAAAPASADNGQSVTGDASAATQAGDPTSTEPSPAINTETPGVGGDQPGILSSAGAQIDKATNAVSGVTTRIDSIKALRASIGHVVFQPFWAVFAFIEAMPWYLWLGVAILVGVTYLAYHYRQLILGRIRELANPHTGPADPGAPK